VEVALDCDLVRRTATTSNVVGVIGADASGGPRELVVIGAHYDHLGTRRGEGTEGTEGAAGADEVFRGADDNASGVAGVLHLAEALRSSAEGGSRALVLALFSGEERGLLGSRC